MEFLVNKANLVHNFLNYVYFFSLHVSATLCPSSGETTVFKRHLVLATPYG